MTLVNNVAIPNCCVFQPACMCAAHRSLAKIVFFIILTPFSNTNGKKKKICKKNTKQGVYEHLDVALKCWLTEKGVKMLKKFILNSEWHMKHLFAGQNTQYQTLWPNN